MARPSTREFSSADEANLKDIFAELRAHFHEWSDDYDSEHDLIAFAFYEGCGRSGHCSSILGKAAPLAVGKELVAKHGFQWTMVRAKAEWHCAVSHPSRGLFIDLQALDDGSWLDKGHEARPPGMLAHDSYEAIVRRLESNS